jgi:phage shock protein C
MVVSCYLHKDREISARCNACNRAICQECNVLLGGRHFCKQCLAEAPVVGSTHVENKFNPEPALESSGHNQLRRSDGNRVLFGVLGGLSRYLSIDSGLLRFIFALLLLLIPIAFALYLNWDGYVYRRYQRPDYYFKECLLGLFFSALPLLFYAVAALSIPVDKTTVRRGARTMRSRKHRVIAGVLGGYADHYMMNTTVMRLAFLYVIFFPLIVGICLPIWLESDMYLAISIVLPLICIAAYAIHAFSMTREPEFSSE